MPPEQEHGPAVYALTTRGAELGRKLARELGGSLHLPHRLLQAPQNPLAPPEQPFDSLAAAVEPLFHARPAHVFIAAAGVAVRIIAPLLRSKQSDPAVLVLDQEGRFCVSLLSGHLGGANDLAHTAAAITGGQAVITTATDTAGAPAMDLLAARAGLEVADISRIKHVNAALAEGRTVAVWDPEGRLGVELAADDVRRHFCEAASAREADVVVDWRQPAPENAALWLHPPCLCLGLGCRKGVQAAEILECVEAFLQRNDAARQSLCSLGTVQAKAGDPGLEQAAAALGLPLTLFSAQQLDAVDVPNPSPQPARAVGTKSVCEAAALLLAGSSGNQGTTGEGGLLAQKHVCGRVTLALAKTPRSDS